MNPTAEGVATPLVDTRESRSGSWRDLPRPQRPRVVGGLLYLVLVTLLFVQPLARLLLHAMQNDLHSHVPLIPLVVGYLLYVQRKRSSAAYSGSIGGTSLLGALGLAALATRAALRESLSVNDELALMALAYVSLLAVGGFLFLGKTWMAAAAFPVAFLGFMIPMPDGLAHGLERASVLGSTEVAALLFTLTGTPLLREGTILALPGIVLEVAQECSGIRSSWALFISSVLASHLFLQSPWRRVVLVAFVIPLAILRNGVRILVIGLLCVRVGPHMIDSVIHHRGGPIFFALSLVPLFLLLWWLRRQEQPGQLAARRP